MKRRLIVLRHAKSAWNTDAPTDHARPLNKRGRRDAPRIAARIRDLGWAPERVISSDSQRTRETWERMRDALGGIATDVTFTRSLYSAGLGAVQAALVELPASVSTVMVIGHNPGWESVVAVLTGDHVRMTTCNAALLAIEADTWRDASTRADWQQRHILRPKEL